MPTVRRAAAAAMQVTFLAVLLITPLLSAAATTMLPFSGDVLLRVESVCRNASTSAQPDSVIPTIRAFTVAGNTASSSLYPFHVRELTGVSPQQVHFSSRSLAYVLLYMWCTKSTIDNYDEDYTHIWRLLRTWITGFSSNGPSVPSTVRDINILTWPSTSISAVIPIDFGGDGVERTFSAVTSTAAAGWSFNGAQAIANPLSLRLTAGLTSSRTLTCNFNIAYFGADVQDPEISEVPPECDYDATYVPTEADPSDDKNPMPAFPPAFAAEFQMIAPSTKKVWTMYESYDSNTGDAMTSIISVHPDNIGRTTKYEWYVDGSTQMSYFYQYTGVSDSKSSLSNSALREYFWPDTETCRRAFIGYGGRTTTSALLLYTPQVTPSFIGNQTVRGIPCTVWSAIVDGARVTWFWARDDILLPQENESIWTLPRYGRLVRMAVEGTGTSAPLFTHHPFFQQGYAMPIRNRRFACEYFGVTGLPGCDNLDNDFFFIYDITSFVPYTLYNDTVLPTVCRGSHVRTVTFPNFQCESAADLTSTALVFVLVALVCLLVGGLCVWTRLSPIIRSLQEDVVKLANELREGEVIRTSAEDEVNAGAAPAAAPTSSAKADANTNASADNRPRV